MGAFYAPCLREGNQILQNKTSKSVDTIRGYTSCAIGGAHARTPEMPLPLGCKVSPGDGQRHQKLPARLEMLPEALGRRNGFSALRQDLEGPGGNEEGAVAPVEGKILQQLLMEHGRHAHFGRFGPADREHFFRGIDPFDAQTIPQKRDEESPCPAGDLERYPAILGEALVKKGLVPERFLPEPAVIAFGRKSSVIPIRLSHGDILRCVRRLTPGR
jgi:hypothetical protein